jgi:lipopolysaccharide export system permease protein
VKKLDWYVLRELVVPFLIGTFAVVLMFQANTLIYLFKNFSIQNIPPLAFLKLILYQTPSYLSMTLPIGMALAASLAISRLTRESELTAMRSGGAGILRVMRPVALFGVAVGFLNFYVVEKVMPRSEKEAARLMQDVMLMGSSPDIRSNVVIQLRNYTAYFETVMRGEDDKLMIYGALLFERPRVGEIWLYSADEGVYDKGRWVFPNATLRQLVGKDLFQYVVGKQVDIQEQMQIDEIFSPPRVEEQTAEELRKSIEDARRLRRDTTHLEVTYHTRYSVPAACFIFALVGPVFAIWLGRSGGFIGVLLSIFIVFLYYNIFVISTQIFGRNGWFDPITAAWLPNGLFLVLGLLGLRKLE